MTEASEPGLGGHDSIPDYVEPVMGVRRWNVVGGALKSTGVSSAPPWKPGQQARATCVQWQPFADDVDGKAAHELEVPVEDCSCGYHAWFDLKTCDQHFPMPAPRVAISERGMIGSIPSSYRAAHEMVAGVVSSWGKIILCEYGFRAEYMKIEALILPENTGVEVLGHSVSIEGAYEALADRYNVPLVQEQAVDTFFMRERGVVLEPDPVPGEETNQIHAYVPPGWKVGPPPVPSGYPNTAQGVQVFYSKPRWRKQSAWCWLASILTAALGLTLLWGQWWVAAPLLVAAMVLAWLPVFVGGAADD